MKLYLYIIQNTAHLYSTHAICLLECSLQDKTLYDTDHQDIIAILLKVALDTIHPQLDNKIPSLSSNIYIDCNKYVDVYRERHVSRINFIKYAQCQNIRKSTNLKVFCGKKFKGHKLDIQNRLRFSSLERDELSGLTNNSINGERCISILKYLYIMSAI